MKDMPDGWEADFRSFYETVVFAGKINDTNAQALAQSVGTDFFFVKHWYEHENQIWKWKLKAKYELMENTVFE